jgi:hypothetical protein
LFISSLSLVLFYLNTIDSLFRYAFSLQERFERLYDIKLLDSLKADTKKGVIFGIGVGSIFAVLHFVYGKI